MEYSSICVTRMSSRLLSYRSTDIQKIEAQIKHHEKRIQKSKIGAFCKTGGLALKLLLSFYWNAAPTMQISPDSLAEDKWLSWQPASISKPATEALRPASLSRVIRWWKLPEWSQTKPAEEAPVGPGTTCRTVSKLSADVLSHYVSWWLVLLWYQNTSRGYLAFI